jgi:competence protein ComEA
MAAVPPRPAASPGLLKATSASLTAWLRWWGAGRIALAAAGAVMTLIGGLWLILTPDPAAISGELSAAARGYVTVPPTEYTLQVRPVISAAISDPVGSLPTEQTVFVHVVGAVERPGVYALPVTARVIDALEAAGGPTDTAHVDAMNLAALVNDGQRLVVPTLTEVRAGSYQAPTGTSSHGSRSPPAQNGNAAVVDSRININAAGPEELTALPGVGPAIAAAIIEDRAARGSFSSVDDLLRVRGIGPAKLEALRSRARV